MMGWTCPKCGSVYSPTTFDCWRCNNYGGRDVSNCNHIFIFSTVGKRCLFCGLVLPNFIYHWDTYSDGYCQSGTV